MTAVTSTECERNEFKPFVAYDLVPSQFSLFPAKDLIVPSKASMALFRLSFIVTSSHVGHMANNNPHNAQF